MLHTEGAVVPGPLAGEFRQWLVVHCIRIRCLVSMAPSFVACFTPYPLCVPPGGQPRTSLLTPSTSSSVTGGMISVPIVLTPELAQLRQDVVSVGGLSLSATMGLGALAPSAVASAKQGG